MNLSGKTNFYLQTKYLWVISISYPPQTERNLHNLLPFFLPLTINTMQEKKPWPVIGTCNVTDVHYGLHK